MKVYPQRDLRSGLVAGRLEGIALPELVWELGLQAETGVLRVTRPPVTRTLFLQDGQVIFSASSDPNDRLGEMLLRRGRVTLGQLEQALAGLRSGRRLGALLVDQGSLNADELVEAVLDQIKGIALDLLTWDVGDYQFVRGPLPSEEVITLRVKTSQLLLEGIRRERSFSRLRTGVGPSSTVYALADDGIEIVDELELTEGERSLIDRLADGEQSVETLCREVPLSNFETYQVLWVLRVLGVTLRRSQRTEALATASRRGQLTQGGFAELLVSIGSAGQTGVLHLARKSCERTFHISDHRCVFATSNDPDDGLVSFLLRRGVISLRDRDEVTNRLLSNKRVGTILREIGAIDDDDLHVMVREHLAEIVFDTFHWDAGEWEFVPCSLPTVEPITLDRSLALLVAEGVRRMRSWTRIIAGCGGMDQPLALSSGHLDVLDGMGAGVEEREVVRALGSPQSPRRVCHELELDDFRVCQILWTLRLLGAVEPASEIQVQLPAAMTVRPGPVAPQPVSQVEALPAPAAPEAPRAPSVEPPADPLPVIASESAETLPAEEGPTEPTGESREPIGTPLPVEVEVQLDARRGPSWELPADVDRIIVRFNAMHRVVYRAVRAEVGAGAVNLVRSCCNQLSASHKTDLLDGVKLNPDGSWDTEGLKRAICNHRIADPWPIYQELLDQVFVTLEPHLGESRADRLRRRVLEIDPSA